MTSDLKESADESTVDEEARPTDEATVEEDTEDEPTAGKDPWRLRLSLPAVLALAVLLLASAGAAVTFGLLLKAKSDVDNAGSEALNTARSFAVSLTTYDYNNLDKNFADVLDGATGDFKNEYTTGSSTLRQLLQQAKATSRGTVLDAGVKSAGTDRVDVVLVANQVVTNAAIKEGQTRVDRSRFLMTLEKHDGRWLVSAVRML